MKIEDFKVGKTIYVPLIASYGTISVGNDYLGSNRYLKYKMMPLKVADVQRIEFPSSEIDSKWKPWYDGYKSTVVKFDTSDFNEIEQDNFKRLYGRSGYHPCMWDNSCTPDDTYEKYKGYLSFKDNLNEEHDPYSYYVLNSMLSSTKKESIKRMNHLKKITLDSIKEEIKYYKKLHSEIKQWLNE